MSAIADLLWYWTSWAGEAGLRSSAGPALDRARETYESEAPMEPGAVNSSASEDDMIRRLGGAAHARRIERRLRALPSMTVQILRLHILGGSLPHGVDASAVLLPSALALVASQRARAVLAAHVASRRAPSPPARPTRLRSRLRRAEAALYTDPATTQLHRAEAEAALYLTTRSLPPEALRAALHEATPEQAAAIRTEAAMEVQLAIRAYETVEVEPERSRPVPTHDPRPWRRGQ